MESLREVFDFVDHERPEVRDMAVEALAGLSLDEASRNEFAKHPEYLAKLVGRLADQPKITLNAFKALINLSKDPRISANLYDHIGTVVEAVLQQDSTFGDFASMLLSNISKCDSCHLEICGHLGRLFDVFLQSRKYNPKASYDILSGVFADVSNTKEGRAFFLQNNFENLFKMLSQTTSSQLMRRGGAVATVKNCLFESDQHAALLDQDDEEDRLLTGILSCLVNPQSQFDEEELDQMILDIQLEHRHSPSEADASIRTLVVEAVILLGTTRLGRDKMRAKNIYPILREWHKQEPEEVLKDLVEKAVELLIRDEDPSS